ncbi:MAG TPA: hypothetical protein VHZ24_21170 [Pirellulales bacterium]|jgi:phosphomannomutase|nr:hypothetical protein [Pirellulales bacterium]
MYTCPGEAYPIDRAVHLGRMAAFYAKCRECPHRTDTGTLPPETLDQLAAVWKQSDFGVRFTAEGVTGIYRHQLTVADVRQLAAAFAETLPRNAMPTVLLAGDDRPFVPSLIAAAAEGLRWAGCRVIDVGISSAGCTAWAAAELQAQGAILIGNPSDEPRTIGLKFWGAGGVPLSDPGGLTRLRKALVLGINRPTRSYGPLERRTIEPDYLATLADRFYALRPLRVVLDTGCRSLVRGLRQLSGRVACEIYCVQDHPPAAIAHSPPLPRSAGRTGALGRLVHQRHAHFGLWIDGDGEACQAVDERGQPVAPEALVALLAEALEVVQVTGAEIVAPATREAVHAAMLRERSTLLADTGSRIWFAEPHPAPDALRLVATLLTALSRSDRPMSEALAASLEPAASSE